MCSKADYSVSLMLINDSTLPGHIKMQAHKLVMTVFPAVGMQVNGGWAEELQKTIQRKLYDVLVV